MTKGEDLPQSTDIQPTLSEQEAIGLMGKEAFSSVVSEVTDDLMQHTGYLDVAPGEDMTNDPLYVRSEQNANKIVLKVLSVIAVAAASGGAVVAIRHHKKKHD